jgi:hypothetical protein
VRAFFISILIVGVAVITAVLAVQSRTKPSEPAPQVANWALWQWGSACRLDPEEARALREAGCDRVWRWVALIEASGNGARRLRRGGAVTGLESLPWEACIRIDPSCTPLLERDGGADLWPLVGEALTAAPGSAGVQIDWDVPTRLLPRYATWLGGLRQRLPKSTPLSCTALLTWLDSPGFLQVANAVDIIVPQCYALGPPASEAEAVVGGADAVALARRLGAIGRPHRIGLATYEQTAINASDGTLRTVAAPLTAEDLLAADIRWSGVRRGSERILDLKAPWDLSIGHMRLHAGDRLRCAQPQAEALAREIAAVRAAAGPGFHGLAIFRLPAPGDLPAFEPRRLAKTMTGKGLLPARLDRDLLQHEGHWQLLLANPGDEDYCPDAPAAVVVVNGEPMVGWTAPGGVLVSPACQGQVCSPARADGCRIQLRFLRAGTNLIVPLQGSDPKLLPCD